MSLLTRNVTIINLIRKPRTLLILTLQSNAALQCESITNFFNVCITSMFAVSPVHSGQLENSAQLTEKSVILFAYQSFVQLR
jgi:hypothetical protein